MPQLCGIEFTQGEIDYIRTVSSLTGVQVCVVAMKLRDQIAEGNPPVNPDGTWNAVSLVDRFVTNVEAFTIWLAGKRADLVLRITANMSSPVGAVAAVLAFVAFQIAVGPIWAAAQATVTYIKAMAFIASIGTIIKTIGTIFQVDTIIMLVQLGDLFIDAFHVQLARIYKALGSLSQELSLEMSYIMVFTESSRAIIHTANVLSGNSFLSSEVDYADALSVFLSGIQGKYKDYAMYPEHIFVDVQKSIAGFRKTEADEKLAGIWAAIDFVTDKARSSGDEIISLLAALDTIKKNAPKDMQDAIDVWYVPFRADYEKFLKDNYYPFWEKTDSAIRIVEANIRAHSIDIEALQKKILTPYDFFALLFNLPDAEAIAEIERTRKILLAVLEDTSVDTAAFAHAHKQALIGTASLDKIDYAHVPTEIVHGSPIVPPVPDEMGKYPSWYRGET
jgi:hypothetical protein